MRVSLGPILYYWPRARIESFYQQLVALPLDVIYLGETVCSKRHALSAAEWIELGRQLQLRGKQVTLSTLVLIESGSELGAVRRLCNNGELLVEANDMGAVQILAEQKLPFVAGPGLNIYNAYTLKLLYRLGMQRWIAPVEISRHGLADILDAANSMALTGIDTEVVSYGRLPLAYSARCFTARAYNLPKDHCEFKCLDLPDGLPMDSRENEPLFTINGIQIQSGQIVNLLPQWREMREIGVSMMRISPIAFRTRDVVEQFCDVVAGATDIDTAMQALPQEGTCNGYWHGTPGMVHVAAT